MTNGYGPLSGLPPGGEVWVATNAGVALMTNVTQNVNPSGYAISTVVMDNSDATGNTAYIGIMGFSTPAHPASHVWQTTNAGASWNDWSGSGQTALPDAPVNALLVDVQEGQIYAGTDVGVFVSSTTAPSWTEVGPAPGPGVLRFLPDAPVTALQMFNPNAGTKTLLASTYGRGIWNFALVTSPGFRNSISNSPQTVFATQTATFDGTITAQDGYANPVNLTCTGGYPSNCALPAQVTFSDNPSVPYTLTAGGAAGDYSFNAHAVGTDAFAVTHDAPITLHVVDFDLTVPSPNSLSVAQGSTSGGIKFDVTASGGFSGTVALSCPAGLPTGTACVFSPSSSVSPTAAASVKVTLTVTATADTALGGPTPVTIEAMTTGAPAAKTRTFDLTVMTPAGDFTWTDTGNPSATVLAGHSASYTFSAAPGGGTFSAAVSFACSGSPALTNCGFNPPSLAAGAGTTTVTLTVTTTGPNGAQSIAREGSARVRTAALGRPGPAQRGPHPWPRFRILPCFALAWLVAGIVGVTRKTCGKPHFRVWIAAVCLGIGWMTLISCGGVTGSDSKGPPPTVSVNPGSATLFADEAGNSWPPALTQQQFSATVNNSANQSVTWAVAGGNANGTVDANGLYTAPAVVPSSAAPATVTAMSAAATAPGSALVNLATPTKLGAWQITVTATAVGAAPKPDIVTLIVQ